jgi:hypothetical protein
MSEHNKFFQNVVPKVFWIYGAYISIGSKKRTVLVKASTYIFYKMKTNIYMSSTHLYLIYCT